MHVIILHSAIADNASLDEQDTLVQVAAVENALITLVAQVHCIPFTLDVAKLSARLHAYKTDVVFNLVESIDDRSQLIHLTPAILQHLTIPFTGGDAQTLFISANKLLAKRLLQANGIATPAWYDPNKLTPATFPSDGPYIIKSAEEDGSLGLEQDSVINDYASMLHIVRDRSKRFGGTWFAERYIAGREFNISILATATGPQVLPIAEMQFTNLAPGQLAFLDYTSKWQVDSAAYQTSARNFSSVDTDSSLRAQLAELALDCWHAFNINSYARVDVRVDEKGRPWVLEVNVNPALTPDAGFIAAAKEAGLDYNSVIKQLIENATRNLCYKN